MSEMMVCPDGEFCDRACEEKHWLPHMHDSQCELSGDCPACIPYIPEQEYECTLGKSLRCGECDDYESGGYICIHWQPKKPATCHHVWLTDGEDIRCELCDEPYFTPADPKPAEPQAEMMPLREQFRKIWLRYSANPDAPIGLAIDTLMEAVEAHDSAVASAAVKEFAEKFKLLEQKVETPEALLFIEGYNRAVRDIRAMAEGGK